MRGDEEGYMQTMMAVYPVTGNRIIIRIPGAKEGTFTYIEVMSPMHGSVEVMMRKDRTTLPVSLVAMHDNGEVIVKRAENKDLVPRR